MTFEALTPLLAGLGVGRIGVLVVDDEDDLAEARKLVGRGGARGTK